MTKAREEYVKATPFVDLTEDELKKIAEAIQRGMQKETLPKREKDDAEFTIMVGGSREVTWNYAARAIQETMGEFDPKKVRIILGDARGTDKIAERVLRSMQFQVDPPFVADWDLHKNCHCRDKSPGTTCRFAGLRRTAEMLDSEKPDLAVLFWDGKSKGTAGTKKMIEERNIPLWVIDL